MSSSAGVVSFDMHFPLVELGEVAPDVEMHADFKDPCSPVFDGKRFHQYFGIYSPDGFAMGHLVSVNQNPFDGWNWCKPILLKGLTGAGVGAPSVIWNGGIFYCAIQQDFRGPGNIDLYISVDGFRFEKAGIMLKCAPGTKLGGIYDPDLIRDQATGDLYMYFSGFPCENQRLDKAFGNLYLARYNNRSEVWEVIKEVVNEKQVWFHGLSTNVDSEWGLEAPSALQMPNGSNFLFGVCFDPTSPKDHRQRLFVSYARSIEGEHRVLGILNSVDMFGGTEYGHGGFRIVGNTVIGWVQVRTSTGSWKLKSIAFRVSDLFKFEATTRV